MTQLYPEESNKLDVVGHLEELRRRILLCLGFIATLAVLLFAQGDRLMRIVKYPLKGIPANLIFIEPAEAFTAYVKVVLLSGFVLSVPFILYQTWRFVVPAVPVFRRPGVARWLCLALVLFVLGLLFSYYLVLPAALNFLLGFGSRMATPSISIGKYVGFFSGLMLIGGTIFEIPMIMGFLAEFGFLKTGALKHKRPYAFLGILIVAGIITPTPDAFNMFLVGIPMYGLYEVGILLVAGIERKNARRGRFSLSPRRGEGDGKP